MSSLTTRINKLRYRYYICDVFTEVRFGGNQLAVLPEATGLSDRQMQQIAREFNFSETTFVFPAEVGHTVNCRRPCAFSSATISAELLASAVSLAPEDIVTKTHLPQVASVGLPFLMAEVKDRAALARARPNVEKLAALVNEGAPAGIHLYTHSADEFDIRARMFAPLDGVPEDPATGSANCALAGLLSHYNEAAEGVFHWLISQGVEMGRPSVLSGGAGGEKRKNRNRDLGWRGKHIGE
jgi:trans-2,3-dihydro-3-hydroxyanthranilate isomerase